MGTKKRKSERRKQKTIIKSKATTRIGKLMESLERTFRIISCVTKRWKRNIDKAINRMAHPEVRLDGAEGPLMEAVDKILKEPELRICTPSESRVYVVTKKSLVKMIGNKLTVIRNKTSIDIVCSPLFETCFKKAVDSAQEDIIKSFDIDVSTRIMDLNEQI